MTKFYTFIVIKELEAILYLQSNKEA